MLLALPLELMYILHHSYVLEICTIRIIVLEFGGELIIMWMEANMICIWSAQFLPLPRHALSGLWEEPSSC